LQQVIIVPRRAILAQNFDFALLGHWV
jgi:hypothetical protein